MMLVVHKPLTLKPGSPVVESCKLHPLPHGGRYQHFSTWPLTGSGSQAHQGKIQARQAIDPTALQGDSVGSQIAFLKNHKTHIQTLADGFGQPMVQTAIAHQENSLNLMFQQIVFQKLWPLFYRADEINTVISTAVKTVAAINIDLVGDLPSTRKLPGQLTEKWPERSLKK